MCKRHLPRNVSRREILRATLAGAGIVALGPLARGLVPVASGAPLPGHRRCVTIFCYGGYDGLNLLVPVTNQAYYDRRPTIQVTPGEALDIGDPDYRLHPSLVQMAQLFNAGEAAAFRKVGYPDANLSHFISQDIHSWGVRDGFVPLGIQPSGWIARYADLHAPTPLGTAAIGVGRPLEFEGGTSHPFLAASLAGFEFDTRSIAAADHEHRLAALTDVLASFSGGALDTEAKVALDQGIQLADQIQAAVTAYEDPGTGSPFKDAYPTSTPGRYLRDVSILVQGGFETEVFMTGFGGWDTHGNQGGAQGLQAGLIARLDAALGTFVAECKATGIWNDMLVLVSTEFGRRNFENGSTGTDHGHGNVFFALGGGVRGGLYGPAITEPDIADANWLGYAVDYRDVFKEAVASHLGEDPQPVFPEPQDIDTTLGYL